MAENVALTERMREIERLPVLRVMGSTRTGGQPGTTPLTIVARQGRLLLRLTAALEMLETGFRERIVAGQQQREELRATVTNLMQAQDVSARESTQRIRAWIEEAIHVLDALERAGTVLESQGNSLAREMVSARADSTRRLAALGVTEIATVGVVDGRLHEAVDTILSESVPPYHIVSVMRSGWQWGDTVVRRALVITAEANATQADSGTIEQEYEREQRGKQSAGQAEPRRRRRRDTTEKPGSRD